MDCKSIGKANPDVAGTGILAAFAVQSLIAVITSGYTWILSLEIEQRKKQVEPDQPGAARVEALRVRCNALIDIIPGFRAVRNLYKERDQRGFPGFSAIKAWLVGKQPEQSGHRNRASGGENEGRTIIDDAVTPTTRRLAFANRILIAGSDTQTFTGIALLISALIQSKTLTLYHMHILYDTSSLVIVSNCAASHRVFLHPSKGRIRLALMTIWFVLFVTYMSVFTSRLQKWDTEMPFHCYKTRLISRPGDAHPLVDNIYVGLTFVYIVLSFTYAVILALQTNAKFRKMLLWQQREVMGWRNLFRGNSRFEAVAARVSALDWSQATVQYVFSHSTLLGMNSMDVQYTILAIALVQCPLHIYSIFALRVANERFLDGGNEEAQWGFGQIAAVVLLGGNVLQIVDGVAEYHAEEAFKKHRLDEEASPRVDRKVGQDVILNPVASGG